MVLTARGCLLIASTHSSPQILLPVAPVVVVLSLLKQACLFRVSKVLTYSNVLSWHQHTFFLIPKVKLAIKGERFSDIQCSVTKILKTVSLQGSTGGSTKYRMGE
jgi:hypothetical protein